MLKHAAAPVYLVLVILLIGCIQPADTAVKTLERPGGSQKVIAVVSLEQETNVFSPVKTTLKDFQARDLYYGEAMIAPSLEQRDQVAGFLHAIQDFGKGNIRIVPIIEAKAASGGPIEKDVYNGFKNEIMTRLRNAGKLDGIYLSLHGSMGVEGLIDPEGDLLQAIRDEFGDQIPIGTSYDQHANMTEKKATLATFIVGFKTNPHRDFFSTGYTSGKLLVRTVQGEIRPTMVVNKLRLLRGGGTMTDFLAPMDGIFSRMREMEKLPAVLCVSNFLVHPFLDEPELGWSTVAVTDNDMALAGRLADEIAELDWSVRGYRITQKLLSPSEAVKAARDCWLERLLGTTMFCDLSDAVGTGSPGENTWILKALAEEAPDLISYVPVRDAEAVQQLQDIPLNETATVTVGGKLEKVYNRPYTFTGQLIFKGEGREGARSSGRVVVLQNQGTHLILTEAAPNTYFPSFFTSLGLDLMEADVVVAKNLFPFRIRFLQYNRKTFNVVSAGTTNIDVFQIRYNNITRPIYPLDEVESWRWEKWESEADK
ncbi:MAG: M81 family metallopeptidase [Dehalococcoidia bacterium]|nr:M81 family metallopeptidase [Dehalococcoidia bacterium]